MTTHAPPDHPGGAFPPLPIVTDHDVVIVKQRDGRHPVIQAFQKRHQVADMVVVADAGDGGCQLVCVRDGVLSQKEIRL